MRDLFYGAIILTGVVAAGALGMERRANLNVKVQEILARTEAADARVADALVAAALVRGIMDEQMHVEIHPHHVELVGAPEGTLLTLGDDWDSSLGPGFHVGDNDTHGHVYGRVMVSQDNGLAYWVSGDQTLGESMAAIAQEEEGHCYPKGANKDKLPPEAQEECRCWEVTECSGNGDTPQGEFRCKRHCKKDNCSCCTI